MNSADPRVPIGRRLFDFATGLVLCTLLVTLLGGRIEVNVLGARLRVSGAARPLVVALILLAIQGLLEGGWIRRLPTALRAHGQPTEDDRRKARLLKRALALCALALVVSPLFLAPQSFFEGPSRARPFVLVVLVLAAYWWLAERGLFGKADERGHRLGKLDAVLLLGLPFYGLLLGNGAILSSGDNMVTREFGPLIIRKHTIELSSIPEFQKKELHYSALRIGDRVLPSFPIGTALLTLPYSAATLAVWRGEITEEFLDRCEKHVAALFGVASALLLFWGVRRRFGENVAIATFALFAFGTTAFTCVGQSLFSTTGEVFLFCLALALVLPEDASLARVIGAGLAMGGAFFCRPSALIATGCVGLALLLRRRRDGLVFGAVAGAVVAIAALWLKLVYGNPLGGYAIMNSQAGMWGQTILVGLAGNLVSPSRGVLLFFPYLLFVPLAAALVRRDPEARTWWLASLLVFTATVGLASGYNKWWGGYSVGPRLTTEAAPFLALLLIPIWQAWRRLGRVRIAIVLSVLLAMATQVLFAYNWRVHSWSAEVLEHHPDALWSLRYGQLAAAWIPAWRPIPDAVNEQFLRRGGTQHWHPLDIASVANARYDLDPFMENAPKDSWSHYPRLDSWSLNTAGQNFQFLPAGKPNAVTTCREAAPAEIPVPRLSGARIHAIVAAGATERRIDQPALAYLEVRYADESTERIPIRLDAEVFEYALERRVGTIDPAKVYAGRAAESDALVVSTFPVAKPQLPILGIRLVGEPTMAPAGVSLFAITLEE